MSQQLSTFVITAGDVDAEVALNGFLRSHRILQIDRTYANGGWQVCVVWQAASTLQERQVKGQKIDYREVLEPETFAVYAKLREVRKAVSEEERIPAFTVFTNEQLAEIARRRCRTAAQIGEVEGVGEARVKKYGDRFIAVIGRDEKQPNNA